jgi:hypothetical protein
VFQGHIPVGILAGFQPGDHILLYAEAFQGLSFADGTIRYS